MQILNAKFVLYLKKITKMSNDQFEGLILLDIIAEKLIGELNLARLLIKTKINDIKVFERKRILLDKILQSNEIMVSWIYLF